MNNNISISKTTFSIQVSIALKTSHIYVYREKDWRSDLGRDEWGNTKIEWYFNGAKGIEETTDFIENMKIALEIANRLDKMEDPLLFVI